MAGLMSKHNEQSQFSKEVTEYSVFSKQNHLSKLDNQKKIKCYLYVAKNRGKG